MSADYIAQCWGCGRPPTVGDRTVSCSNCYDVVDRGDGITVRSNEFLTAAVHHTDDAVEEWNERAEEHAPSCMDDPERPAREREEQRRAHDEWNAETLGGRYTPEDVARGDWQRDQQKNESVAS